MSLDAKSAFSALPTTLADELLTEFNGIVTAYAERRWKASELDVGHLCEVVYTIIIGYLDGGQYPDRAAKPSNFPASCWKVQDNYPKTANHSARILIPRMMMGVYDIRNNRGVGHAGGDVDPNEMDATAALYVSKWLMAELVRLLHDLSLDAAQELVDAIVEREIPAVWIHGDKRRVLAPGLKWREKVLLVLVNEAEVPEADLMRWVEHKSLRDFRKILRSMHAVPLIDYDESSRTVRLLPPGVNEAEKLVARLRQR